MNFKAKAKARAHAHRHRRWQYPQAKNGLGYPYNGKCIWIRNRFNIMQVVLRIRHDAICLLMKEITNRVVLMSAEAPETNTCLAQLLWPFLRIAQFAFKQNKIQRQHMFPCSSNIIKDPYMLSFIPNIPNTTQTPHDKIFLTQVWYLRQYVLPVEDNYAIQ